MSTVSLLKSTINDSRINPGKAVSVSSLKDLDPMYAYCPTGPTISPMGETMHQSYFNPTRNICDTTFTEYDLITQLNYVDTLPKKVKSSIPQDLVQEHINNFLRK